MIITLIHNVIATRLSQTAKTRGKAYITDYIWQGKLFPMYHQTVSAEQLNKTPPGCLYRHWIEVSCHTCDSLTVSLLTSNCSESKHCFNLSISSLASCIASSFSLLFSVTVTNWDLCCSPAPCNCLSLSDSCWNKQNL